MLHNDGTKYSEGLIPQAELGKTPFPNFVEARIDEILYTDDLENTTRNSPKREIQYNCTIVGGNLDGMRLFNVRDTVKQGGQFNASAQVRSAVRKGRLEPPITDPQDTDGDYVLVCLVGNNPYRSRIVQGLPHPKNNLMDIKKEDGIHEVMEYNGMQIATDKDGALTITNTGGPKNVDGQSTNENAAGACIKISADGAMSMEKDGKKIELDKDGQILINGPDDTIFSLKDGGNSEISSNQMELKAKNAFNVKSTLTQIGNNGIPSARIGDICIGSGNHGAPVVSKIINGSYISMIGS